MAKIAPIQGDLQAQIMAVLWRIDAGTVEEVRQGLPQRYRGAYTTVQTVLNRLTERGLLIRKRHGQAFVYRPRISEAEYVSRSIASTLASTTSAVRHAALAQVIGSLDRADLAELQRLAEEAQATRRRKR